MSGGNIIWVSDAHQTIAGSTVPDDQGWVDLLRSKGYNVDYQPPIAPTAGYWQTLDASKLAALDAADLVDDPAGNRAQDLVRDVREVGGHEVGRVHAADGDDVLVAALIPHDTDRRNRDEDGQGLRRSGAEGALQIRPPELPARRPGGRGAVAGSRLPLVSRSVEGISLRHRHSGE